MSATIEPTPATPSQAHRASRIARLVATAGGLGYIPFAPGTWGSLAGVLIYTVLLHGASPYSALLYYRRGSLHAEPLIAAITMASLGISIAGIVAAYRVCVETGQSDPQHVVIDEVSGQLLTYILAVTPPNWKYLLLGFILFRVFDIWKPFPARQAESLPGGWGIMADDWVAGIYAALGLWIARMLGL